MHLKNASRIVPKFVPADFPFLETEDTEDGNGDHGRTQNYSVSLATHTDVGHLLLIIDQANAWKGPISAAVYVAGINASSELVAVARAIAVLRHCAPRISARITFSLVLDYHGTDATRSPFATAARPPSGFHVSAAAAELGGKFAGRSFEGGG